MADHMVEEGTILRVTMEVRLPVAATADQISEWLKSEVGQFGGVSISNPLRIEGPQAFGYEVNWDDTGMTGREEEYDRVDHGDGRSTYKTRLIRKCKGRPAALPPAGGR